MFLLEDEPLVDLILPGDLSISRKGILEVDCNPPCIIYDESISYK